MSDSATSRSGNRSTDLALLCYSLRRGFRFIAVAEKRHRLMISGQRLGARSERVTRL